MSANQSLAELFDSDAADLYRYLARRAGAAVAEHVLSATFLQALESYRMFDPARGSQRAWLYGIAANLLRRHHRAEARRWQAYARYPVERADDPSERAAERADAAGNHGLVAQAVARLDARDRDVLLLYAWAELSYAEIAQALDLPVGTVRSRLSRARRQVRAGLDLPDPIKELR